MSKNHVKNVDTVVEVARTVVEATDIVVEVDDIVVELLNSSKEVETVLQMASMKALVEVLNFDFKPDSYYDNN